MDVIFPVLILLLAVAAFSDIKFRKIPNWITLFGFLLALTYHTIQNGFSGFSFSLLGMLTGIGLLILPYILGGMGAGDTKLLGAVGAFIGAKGVFSSFLLIALFGGLYALAVSYKGFPHFSILLEDVRRAVFTRTVEGKAASASNSRKICYGVPIALGTYVYIGCNALGVRLF